MSITDALRLRGLLAGRMSRGLGCAFITCIHGCINAAVALYLLRTVLGLGLGVRGVRVGVDVTCEGLGLGVGVRREGWG